MSRLIAVEGLDGSGKRTLTDSVSAAMRRQGAKVRTLAFPRYGRSVTADLAREALYGRAGDLGDSVFGMATLFALDRAGAIDELRRLLDECDVVLLDRYVASNAAYGAARLFQKGDGEFVEWVKALEICRLELPVPDAHILLRVDPVLAADRAQDRERDDVTRVLDVFESDRPFQARVADVYEQLAAQRWLAPWTVVDGATSIDVTQKLVVSILHDRPD